MSKQDFEEIPPAGEQAHEPQQGSEAADFEALREELDKFKDLAHRSRADLENYRKRMVREKEDALRYANAGLLEKLLPVVDSFELGLQAAGAAPEGAAIAAGFEMVHKQLADFLRDNGVEVIDAMGKPFDPNQHEAVSQQNDEQVAEGLVSLQIRKGYKLKDRLLRPAMVIVSLGPVTDGLASKE